MNEQVKKYLDALRDSGVVNMMGAGAYLQRAFGMNRYEAKQAVLDWIDTFKQGDDKCK